MGERSMGERSPTTQGKARPMPFSQEIMVVVVPTNFMTPKIVFRGTEDLEAHLTAFNAQMMISGGNERHALQAVHGHVHKHNDGVARRPPRWPHHFFRLVFCSVQRTVHRQSSSIANLFRPLRGETEAGRAFEGLLEQVWGRQPSSTTSLFRPLRGETEAGRAFERLLEQVWGVCGKTPDSGRGFDGPCLWARDYVSVIQ